MVYTFSKMHVLPIGCLYLPFICLIAMGLTYNLCPIVGAKHILIWFNKTGCKLKGLYDPHVRQPGSDRFFRDFCFDFVFKGLLKKDVACLHGVLPACPSLPIFYFLYRAEFLLMLFKFCKETNPSHAHL